MEMQKAIDQGKITVINTLAIPPLLYLANVIIVPPQVISEF